ncbi:MAG: hypothetical protein HQK64_10875 [Desulfamplus sp.]|nr:hypothetical protein [Desulfamplus sp.]
MKITNPETIQSGAKELIDFINAELDWGAIEEMILKKHKLQLQDEVIYRQGDIVVYDNQIAYKLDFDIKVSLELIFNREGECVDMNTSDLQDKDQDKNKGDKESEDFDVDGYAIQNRGSIEQNNWSKMASNIAEMIHDINQDTSK